MGLYDLGSCAGLFGFGSATTVALVANRDGYDMTGEIREELCRLHNYGL